MRRNKIRDKPTEELRILKKYLGVQDVFKEFYPLRQNAV
jgi:hypothetical protein